MKYPPLNALRYFDVAARTGSFIEAAQILNVTHGAVSRQIRLLEETLDIALFERRNRAVYLTKAGAELSETTNLIFEQLERTLGYLQQNKHENNLVFSCEPSIAMKWLIPRLPDFYVKHPDINLQLVADGGSIDFAKTGVDIALRRNDFYWGIDLYDVKISDEYMGPVGNGFNLPQKLDNTQLLFAATRPRAWEHWQKKTGIVLKSSKSKEYQHFYLCIQAAVAGLGLAMASFLMVQDELACGQLKAPYGFIPDGSSYYLLSPCPFTGIRAVFQKWIIEQIEISLAQLPSTDV